MQEKPQPAIKASQAEIIKWLDAGIDPELLSNTDKAADEQPATAQNSLGQVAITHLDQ
jgi:hypothetical protein